MRRSSELHLAVFAAAVACATLASASLVHDRMSPDLRSAAAALPRPV
jgi:hypothetical protein